MKAVSKSLILSFLIVFINWFAYFSFRWFGFGETNIWESLGFTAYISVIDFIVVFLVSFSFFKLTAK